jgi:hypothetical protein
MRGESTLNIEYSSDEKKKRKKKKKKKREERISIYISMCIQCSVGCITSGSVV